MWFLLSKTLTGKYPWQDKRSKFLSIPIGPENKFRHSKIGTWLWGNGPEIGYLGVYSFNPLIMRGARALGIPGAYETMVLGGTPGQASEAAAKDILNTISHPFLGPEPRAAWTFTTGREAYLTSLRDKSGQIEPSFLPAVPQYTKPGLPSLGQRTLAAAMELNAFSASLGDMAGIRGDQKPDKGRSAALNDVLNMSVIGTGLINTATNPYARATAIHQQERNIRSHQKTGTH
jgi:hypothetical protein